MISILRTLALTLDELHLDKLHTSNGIFSLKNGGALSVETQMTFGCVSMIEVLTIDDLTKLDTMKEPNQKNQMGLLDPLLAVWDENKHLLTCIDSFRPFR